MDAARISVLIAGRSHASLAAAVLLARWGVRTALAAGSPVPAAAGAETILGPRAMEVYRALGVAPALLTRARPAVAGPTRSIADDALASVLIHAARHWGAEVDTDACLLSLRATPSGVTATVRHQGAARPRIVSAGYAVLSAAVAERAKRHAPAEVPTGRVRRQDPTFVLNDGTDGKTLGRADPDTGVLDALNLAWKLALVLDGAADVTLLDSYERERCDRDSHRLADEPVECAEVGRRAPDFLVEAPGKVFPIHDLFYRGFVLITPNPMWAGAARRLAVATETPLRAYVVGTGSDESDLVDVDRGWAAHFPVGAHGAVLVRPDGIVAWITEQPPFDGAAGLAHVLCGVLGDRAGGYIRGASMHERWIELADSC